jgi:hypothetical protein
MNLNLGRIVLYTLSPEDEAAINGRRSRNEPTVECGQVCTMLVTREGVESRSPTDARAAHTVDGLVFLNGDVTPFFVRSRIFGDGFGEWQTIAFSEREFQSIETKARKLAVQV